MEGGAGFFLVVVGGSMLVLFYLLIALVAGLIGKRREIGFGRAFGLTFVLGVVLFAIVVYLDDRALLLEHMVPVLVVSALLGCVVPLASRKRRPPE